MKYSELDAALVNLESRNERKGRDIQAVNDGRLIRSEAQRADIMAECDVLKILADTAKFGKDNFFDELGVFKPLRWYQPKRMFAAASYLVSIVRQISACFK